MKYFIARSLVKLGQYIDPEAVFTHSRKQIADGHFEENFPTRFGPFLYSLEDMIMICQTKNGYPENLILELVQYIQVLEGKVK